MKTTALIALAAVLFLSLGGLFHVNAKACCGTDMPFDTGAQGSAPCVGLCTTAAPTSVETTNLSLLGWFLFIPLLHPIPLLADPIEKPPA